MTRIAAPGRDIVCDLFRMSEKLSKDVLPLHLLRVVVELSGNKLTWFLVHHPVVVEVSMSASTTSKFTFAIKGITSIPPTIAFLLIRSIRLIGVYCLLIKILMGSPILSRSPSFTTNPVELIDLSEGRQPPKSAPINYTPQLLNIPGAYTVNKVTFCFQFVNQSFNI